MGANNRRQLARTCKKYGLLVQPNALPVLMREMEERGDRFLDLLEVLKQRLARAASPKLVNLQLVEMVLEEEQQKQLQKAAKRKKNKIVLQDEIEPPPQSQTTQTTENSQTATELFRSQPKSKSRPAAKALLKSSKPWKVISAFDMPKLVYDSMGRQFHYEYSRKSLMGTAKDLMDMRIHRYQLIKQKVDRHREQRRLSPLTTIDRLLGATTSSSAGSERILLGMLRSNPSLGCLELEDPTGSVPLRIDLSSSSTLFSSNKATTVDTNGLYMEGSMVLVSGHQEESELSHMVANMDDSSGTVFRCTSIELPPLENTNETKSHLPPSPYMGAFSNGFRKPSLKTPVPIYSLSNLSLDDEECLERVGDVIDRMTYDTSGSQDKENEAEVGAILVLFGNFCTESLSTSNALDELARLLQDKAIPSRHSILLIPGPNDVGSNACWPLPAFSKKNTPSSLHSLLALDGGQISNSRNKVPESGNVHLCTNPCRLEFSDGRQVLLMRKNLIRESLQHQVLGDARSSTGGDLPPLASRVFYHTLSQCHLSPSSSSQQAAATSGSPIYWNYDYSLSLYPLPDLMVLGLDAEYLEDGAHYGRAGCRIVSPISNPSRNEWQCSVTTMGRKDKIYVEFDNADDDDDDDEDEAEMEDVDDQMEEVPQTDEEIYEKYNALVGTQDTQFSQTQLSAY